MTDTRSKTAGAGDDENWAKLASERAMDWVDAEADKWAEEVSLMHIIKGMSATAGLSQNGPPAERQKLIDRWEANLDSWCKQVFLEAWLRSYDSYKEYRDNLSAQSDTVQTPSPPPLNGLG